MALNLIAGLLLGLFSGSLFFVLHSLDLLRAASGGQMLWAAVACHGAILILVLWRHRSADATVGFARLLAAGLMVSLVAALVSGLGAWIFVSWVDPTFVQWVQEQSLAQLEQFEIPADQKALQEAQIRAAGANAFVTQGMLATLVRGLVFSVPIAALMRLRAARKTS